MKRAAKAIRVEQEQAREAAHRRRRRLIWLGAAFLAVLAVSIVGVFAVGGKDSGKAKAPTGAREVTALYAGIPQQGSQLGDPRAPITLTEFADLQCPFCAHYAKDVQPTIVKRYVRTGKVRLDFRILTFIGPDSDRAGRMAAAAARQNKLWNFTELFYKNQGTENTGYADDAFLRGLGGAIPGFNVERAMRLRGSAPVTMQLENDKEQAARHAIDSTPSFLIARRGQPAQAFRYTDLKPETFTQKLDQELRAR